MSTWILSFIGCSGFLLAVYFILLQRKRMFFFNRLYLISALLLSMLIPLVTIDHSLLKGKQPIPVYLLQDLLEAPSQPLPITGVENTASHTAAPAKKLISDLDWATIALACYIIVTLLLLMRFFFNLARMSVQHRDCPRFTIDGINFICVDGLPTPYSFWNSIYADYETWQKDPASDPVLQHEIAHISQRHSVDILYMEIIGILCWFNPFVYLYRKAIRLNHEFLADASVTSWYDAVSYQYLLLQKAEVTGRPFISPFNFSHTKKRLTMISRSTTMRARILTGVSVMPMIGLTAILFCNHAGTGTGFSTLDALIPAGSSILLTERVPWIEGNSNNSEDALSIPGSDSNAGADTSKPKRESVTAFAGSIPPGPGASDEELQTFNTIVERSRRGAGTDQYNALPEWRRPFPEPTVADRATLVSIYRKMNAAQRAKSEVQFFNSGSILKKKVPTSKAFEAFKNPAVYGIWIDDKKVANDELNKYQNTDFSNAMVSKLYGGAKKGRSYTHQLNLMTNAYYSDYLERAKKDTGLIMIVTTSFPPPAKK